MKKAWVENNVIRDICQGDPAECYHPDVAIHYATDVPDTAENGWILVDGTWEAPPVGTPFEPVTIYPSVSPVEFQLLFTSAERVAIKAARATDPIIDDFMDIVEHPKLTFVNLNLASTQSALDYFISLNILTSDRKAAILTGVIQ